MLVESWKLQLNAAPGLLLETFRDSLSEKRELAEKNISKFFHLQQFFVLLIIKLSSWTKYECLNFRLFVGIISHAGCHFFDQKGKALEIVSVV